MSFRKLAGMQITVCMIPCGWRLHACTLRPRAWPHTPCRPLAAVAREQAVFELEEQEGSLIGFWSPPFMGSAVTVPGFHLHFLSADRQRGGHVLEAKMLRGTAYIQPVSADYGDGRA